MQRVLLFVTVVVAAGAVTGCQTDSEAEGTRDVNAPINLGSPINTDSSEYNPEISEDGLSLIFSSRRTGGYGSNDIWISNRADPDAQWEEPENLGPAINTEHWETGPTLTGDMLELYFTSTRFDTGARGIYVARRPDVEAPFEQIERLGEEINTPDHVDSGPYVTYDGLLLVFSSDRPGGEGDRDLYMTTRDSRDEDFRPAWNLGAVVNSASYDSSPTMTADKLKLFFHSDRNPDHEKHDLYVTERSSLDAEWSRPVSVGHHINTARYHEGTPSISPDGSTLLFRSERPGGLGHQDIWMVNLSPDEPTEVPPTQ